MKKVAMKKAMKKAAMKRTMKAKKVSKIAKGKRARSSVFHGTKAKTMSGLTKADITKNNNGKLVSKKASAAAKKKVRPEWCEGLGYCLQGRPQSLGYHRLRADRWQDGCRQGSLCQGQVVALSLSDSSVRAVRSGVSLGMVRLAPWQVRGSRAAASRKACGIGDLFCRCC